MLLRDKTLVLAHLLSLWIYPTNAGAQFRFSVSDWRKCDDSNDEYLIFRNIAIQNCVLQCHIRLVCIAVKFLVTRRECRLLETDINVATTYNHRPCVFIRMVDVIDLAQIPSSCQGCSGRQICDVMTDTCEFKECEQLSVPNATVSGNMLSVGARVKVSPNTGYTLGNYSGESRCQTSGNWDSVPTANYIDCGDPPAQPYATVSTGNNVYGTIKSYTCVSGYGVTDPSTDMSITCLSNGTWTTVGFQCEATCVNPWVQLGQSCYFTSTNTKLFVDAEAHCSSLGGHLVHIESFTENNLLLQYLVNMYGSSSSWWLGMTDAVTEGQWVFTQSSVIASFFDWGPGEPSNTGNQEHCAVIGYSNTDWADVKCNTLRKVFCEK